MESKTFEIRDNGTMIPVLAVRLRPPTQGDADRFLFHRGGYTDESDQVLMMQLQTGKAVSRPDQWGRNRTMILAHRHLEENWEDEASGEVIDIAVLTGKSKVKRLSERYSNGK